VELISIILSFATLLLELIDEVTRPIHLHALHTFFDKVHHEPSDLCGEVPSYQLSNYELVSDVHYAILDRGYLVAFLSFFKFAICFLDVLF
jgi:hypothetical protein